LALQPDRIARGRALQTALARPWIHRLFPPHRQVERLLSPGGQGRFRMPVKMRSAQRNAIRFGLIALTASLLLSGCFNKEAIRPSDILQRSPGKTIVLLSTSANANSVMFATALVFHRVADDGTRTPVIVYEINNPAEHADLPERNTKLRWFAVDPG